VFAGQRRVPR